MRASRSRFRSAAFAATFALASASAIRAQDPVPPAEPAPEAAAAEPAPEAASADPIEKPRFRKGVHRVRLSLGYNSGQTVRDAGILAAPITGEPGAPSYPAASELRVELESSAQANFGYTYYFHDKWGVDLGVARQASSIVDAEFDEAQMDAQLATTNLTVPQLDNLRARIVAHSQPHDMTVTYFDIGASRIFAPRSKWPFEVGAGLGWAFGSLGDTTIGDRVVYERLVTSRVVREGDPSIPANDIPQDALGNAPPFVEEGCLADNDPCIEMTEASGLTWNASATIHRAFTEHAMLDIGGRVRFVEQILDPGDSFITLEFGVGVSFLFGGK